MAGASGQSPKIVKTIGGSNMVTLAKPGQIVGGKQTIVINKPGTPGATIKGELLLSFFHHLKFLLQKTREIKVGNNILGLGALLKLQSGFKTL